jgi:hypothetical protein
MKSVFVGALAFLLAPQSRESACCAPAMAECRGVPCADPGTRRQMCRNRPSKRFKGYTAHSTKAD